MLLYRDIRKKTNVKDKQPELAESLRESVATNINDTPSDSERVPTAPTISCKMSQCKPVSSYGNSINSSRLHELGIRL